MTKQVLSKDYVLRKTVQKNLKELRIVGTQLSNLAFNLFQNEEYKGVAPFRDLYTAWDKAILNLPKWMKQG